MFFLIDIWFLGELNIVEHDATFGLVWEHLLREILYWTWNKLIFTKCRITL